MKNYGGARYHTLSFELKRRYNEKLYKVALNGGMTCPNRDGRLGRKGCIFCSAGGSGDFAGSPHDSIPEQLEKGKDVLKEKYTGSSYIAYFQAYTNTYAPINYLKKIYYEAINDPEVKVLSIATRPDCLSPDVLALLDEINKIKPVWIELGLQTSNLSTAHLIRRGYTNKIFEMAVENLRSRNIDVIVHVILCLPDESKTDMINTVMYLNEFDIQGIKLQLLHVLKNTDLAALYEEKPFYLPTEDEYISLICTLLAYIRPEITIHRLTGDGPEDLLIAPLFTRNKRHVLNGINRYLKEHKLYQGKYLGKESH